MSVVHVEYPETMVCLTFSFFCFFLVFHGVPLLRFFFFCALFFLCHILLQASLVMEMLIRGDKKTGRPETAPADQGFE